MHSTASSLAAQKNRRPPTATPSAWLAVLLALGWSLICAQDLLAQTNAVGPIPQALRQKLKLDPFYQKYTLVGPLPIVGSEKVSDYALLEGAYIIGHMLAGHPAVLEVLATNGVKVVIMAHDEYTTDLPEQRELQPRAYWDNRARGLGAQTCSGAEENLLCFPGDPYAAENILIHEFGHVVHQIAMKALDPSFNSRLEAAYHSALKRGLWKNTYAGTNPAEYWAEAVQDWFDNNRHDDSCHNHVHTRAMLKEYDPGVAQLCAEAFGEIPWRYLKPMQRAAAERAHLAGYDPAKAPRFHWRILPITAHPHVSFETTLGSFEVELETQAAPVTVTNFLHYVQQRLYNGGQFFRTVTLTNQPNDPVRIQVIQAEANPARRGEFLPPIPLERTCSTGLHHKDGTLSMARSGPDSAQDSFSICIGDQPELDFGGKRNPDGQGFAAFGHVVKGMDVVRKIHEASAEGQRLTPPVRIEGAIQLD